MDTVFTFSPAFSLPFWILVVIFPHWQWTVKIISSPWIVAPMALLFSVLVLPHVGDLLAEGLPTLEGTAANLGTDWGTTLVWTHIQAFDLLAARWVYLDYRRRGYSAWPMALIFATIFRLGPLGLLAYLLVTRIRPGRTAD